MLIFHCLVFLVPLVILFDFVVYIRQTRLFDRVWNLSYRIAPYRGRCLTGLERLQQFLEAVVLDSHTVKTNVYRVTDAGDVYRTLGQIDRRSGDGKTFIIDMSTRETELLLQIIVSLSSPFLSLAYQPGAGGSAAPRLGQSHYFSGKKTKFFVQKRAAKNEKEIFFVFIKRKNRDSLCPHARWSAQNPGFLLIITGWGESGKVILQVSELSVAVFFWRWRKNFRPKMAQPAIP